MNKNINISAIINSCDRLQGKVIQIEGAYHGSSFIFNQCMRVFDCTIPAEAITFSAFFNAPVMKSGFATIHRDGRLEMRTGEI